MRRILAVLGAIVALAACGGDDQATSTTSTTSTASPDVTVTDAVAFTWTSTVDVDGFGADVTAEGVVGASWARYTLHADPIVADRAPGDYEDLLAQTTTAAINGFDDAAVDDISLDGFSEVVVIGDDRWYRLPWALEELGALLGGTEWIHVTDGDPMPAIDLVSFVVVERWDGAVRRLLGAIATDETFTPPQPEAEAAGYVLADPWSGTKEGLSPAAWSGADPTSGTASWEDLATYEPDGFDGRLAAEVSWSPTTGPVPEPPAPAVEATELAERLG